ncbi:MULTISPECIES: hypothetical protein [Bacillus]|uniref:HEAT repeat domain-containing protein n=2 Tax=Bacillus TaxID=1386 RepID=A0A0M4FIL0_9BACI|nr:MULTISPECIES: hypothetical protein [Bacillus]ALC82761.1 hypothetical protein AM592_15090 [Bacillus gobiensis]MBP1081715.1 hypothetical protein [Bacillus capparidis]MED1096368.1 hypothetical protein [Bacillus capparidis]
MDSITKSYFENLEAKDKSLQLEAFQNIMDATKGKVDWAYEVWDQLIEWLTDPDNHRRSRAAQFLAGLAISDPDKRMLCDFPALWEVTKDPKFVTARHSLQSIWKVGLAGPEQKEMVLNHIIERFKNGMNEKHYTLIRYDMIEGLKKLYDEINDEHIKEIAMTLIESEEDSKYRKKYLSAWK